MSEGYDDHSEWLVAIVLALSIAAFIAALFGVGYVVDLVMDATSITLAR